MAFQSPSYSEKDVVFLQLVNILSEIAKNYGYMLIDYSSNARFLSDSSLFKDISHLNDKGARMYTDCVIRELRRCY